MAHREPMPSMRRIETVLVVDDDPTFLCAIVKRINSLGRRGVGATDCDRAIEHARAYCPQLVLVDLLMPGRDGISTIACLRELDRDMTIVLMSGALEPMHVAGALTAGAVDCINKPVEPIDLIRLVENQDRGPSILPPQATLADVERLCLIRALVDTRGNRSQAARQLGITRCGLQKKLKKSVGQI